MSAGSNSYDYDANGNMTTRNGSTINYASYNLPTSIASGANSSTLAYGAWRNTVKQVAVTSGSTETTIYVAGLLEKVTKGTATEYRHRIEATPGTVAIYVRKSAGGKLTYYLHRDHLGSPEMITNASGTSVVKLSFSAYGERRDVDWDGPITNAHLTSASNVTRHGYTDHLHLDSVKLVHMGGRVYDPVIGRFLSRDPYIDGVDSSQCTNGYAYVWNNPLSRWDPTGYGGTHENFAVWANSGRWERRIVNGQEEFVLTESQSYWEPLASAVFRLGNMVTGGTSGDGGELGGGSSGSGGDSGPEGSKEEDPQQESCHARDVVNSRARFAEGPDFFTIASTVAGPIPIGVHFTIDRYGNTYGGPGVGFGMPAVGFVAGYLLQPGETLRTATRVPSAEELTSFLSGASSTIGVAVGVQVNLPDHPSDGRQAAVLTPLAAGVSYSMSFSAGPCQEVGE